MENNIKKIVIKSNKSRVVTFEDFCGFENVTITVQKDAKLNLRLASFNKTQNVQLKVILKENASSDMVYADFSDDSISFRALIKLEGEYSNASWKLSSLSKKEENKNFDISFIHEAKNTISNMENYGVGMDNSKLVFKGVSHILNGSSNSNAIQQAKIIVFDDGVDASSSPSLRIDENDVNASHAAIVGRLNEEHLYYLMSRGLSEDEARKLITYGYLSPIAQYFDLKTQEEIMNKIKSRL